MAIYTSELVVTNISPTLQMMVENIIQCILMTKHSIPKPKAYNIPAKATFSTGLILCVRLIIIMVKKVTVSALAVMANPKYFGPFSPNNLTI